METGRPVQMSRDNVFPPSVFCQGSFAGPWIRIRRPGYLKNDGDPF